jgi:hypothetical protein
LETWDGWILGGGGLAGSGGGVLLMPAKVILSFNHEADVSVRISTTADERSAAVTAVADRPTGLLAPLPPPPHAQLSGPGRPEPP